MSDREEFLEMHDRFLEMAAEAYVTTDAAPMAQFNHPSFHGYFGTRKQDKADYYEFADSLEGIKQTALAFPNIKSGFAHRHVRMPSPTDAIVFYEKSMDFGKHVGYAMVMEVWRKVDNQWLLVRETIESA